jgi:magnesium and cobalt transporter
LDEETFETIGGYISHAMGHVPRRGEHLQIDHLRFEVLRSDARQVHVLLVEKLPQRSTTESS